MRRCLKELSTLLDNSCVLRRLEAQRRLDHQHGNMPLSVAGLNLLAAVLSMVLVRPRRLPVTATLCASGLSSVPLYRLLHHAVA